MRSSGLSIKCIYVLMIIYIYDDSHMCCTLQDIAPKDKLYRSVLLYLDDNFCIPGASHMGMKTQCNDFGILCSNMDFVPPYSDLHLI